MTGRDAREPRTVLDELANALQGAVGLTALLRQHAKIAADDAFAVDVAIARAVTALRRLQPPSGPAGDEK
jgi:hypothetical protein